VDNTDMSKAPKKEHELAIGIIASTVGLVGLLVMLSALPASPWTKFATAFTAAVGALVAAGTLVMGLVFLASALVRYVDYRNPEQKGGIVAAIVLTLAAALAFFLNR
jgi:hypothetical protein